MMPGRNGYGPRGEGPGTGRGRGYCRSVDGRGYARGMRVCSFPDGVDEATILKHEAKSLEYRLSLVKERLEKHNESEKS